MSQIETSLKPFDADIPRASEFTLPEPIQSHLDSEDTQERFRRLRTCFDYEREIQASNRLEMAQDEDFYDHLQWSADDKYEIELRGQKATVFNKIKPACDWAIGTERKTRVDFNVVPRGEEDIPGASAKKELLKYLHDANKAQYARSLAFEQCVKAGIGWLETGIRMDKEDEPMFLRTENWRNLWYDSHSFERDYSDARYIFRRRQTDLDIAVALFPEKKDVLEAASQEALLSTDSGLDDEFPEDYNPPLADEFGRVPLANKRTSSLNTTANSVNSLGGRPMVDLVECWYRSPLPVGSKIIGGVDNGPVSGIKGEVFDPTDPLHDFAFRNNLCSLYDSTKLYTRCMIWEHASGTILQDIESPYRHNKIPFVPLWAWRRGRDNAPYGLIRGMKSAQEDLNKRHSKTLHLLVTKQVRYEKGAIDDLNHFMDELAKPDGALEINENKMGSVMIDTGGMAEAQSHVQLMQMDAQYIVENSGVQQENLGIQTNATSRVAIEQRQQQGSLTTYTLFDNAAQAYQMVGELELSNVEQFYTEPKLVRILGDKGKVEFIRMNEQKDDGTIENPIAASQADFILSTQDFRESARMAMFEELMGLIGKLPPEVSLQLLDVVVDMTDFHNKDELVSRIRKLNGQTDPDEAANAGTTAGGEASSTPTEQQSEEQPPPDPAQQAAMEAQSQLQQAQTQKIQAEIEKITADIELIKAKTQQTLASPELDDRQMKVREAEAVDKIQDNHHKRVLSVTPGAPKVAGYKESGLQANNIQ